MLLPLGIPITSVNGLIPQNDYRVSQPFTYKQTHVIQDQKVIFKPNGLYATNLTFLHAKIRVPNNHIALHINQTDDFINQLHQLVEGSIF